MNEMVERVAKAVIQRRMERLGFGFTGKPTENELDEARAAISAMHFPTEAMIRKAALWPIAKWLAKRYATGEQVEIARLCDEELDCTGNLLGWVRDAVLAEKESPK